MRRVPLPLTEEALRLVRMTHADFSRSGLASGPLAGRHTRHGALGHYNFREVRAQSHYLRMISIVEAYIDTLSGQLFDAKTASLDEFYKKLADDAGTKASSGWGDRKDGFKRFHGIALGLRDGWDVIDASIQVRNAVAHGLGGLTTRQRNAVTRAKIAKAGVSVSDNRILISQEALNKCFEACVAFILDVDTQVPRR